VSGFRFQENLGPSRHLRFLSCEGLDGIPCSVSDARTITLIEHFGGTADSSGQESTPGVAILPVYQLVGTPLPPGLLES
jgi:hypothetical protein